MHLETVSKTRSTSDRAKSALESGGDETSRRELEPEEESTDLMFWSTETG
jgi:hypothetical protein